MLQIDRRTLSVFGLAALLPPRFAAHDVYPSRPIHIIVGFTPGAAADITARVLGESMGPILSQQIVVENKPGAGSSIAAAYVGHEARDGYTLFLATLSIIVNQIINPNPSFDLTRDLAPVALLTSIPVILVVNPDARALPDAPTLEEQAIADFDTSLWFGLFAPAGTPGANHQ